MAIAVGTQAPDFTLKTMTAAGIVEHSLSDNIGTRPTVLLFVPGAFTSVCTAEFCEVSTNFGDWSDGGADVWGVTNDTPWSLAAWAKQEGITIPLLSDFAHKVCEAYGTAILDFAGLGPGTARAAVVVDSEGIVRYSLQTERTGDQIDLEPVKALLKELARSKALN